MGSASGLVCLRCSLTRSSIYIAEAPARASCGSLRLSRTSTSSPIRPCAASRRIIILRQVDAADGRRGDALELDHAPENMKGRAYSFIFSPSAGDSQEGLNPLAPTVATLSSSARDRALRGGGFSLSSRATPGRGALLLVNYPHDVATLFFPCQLLTPATLLLVNYPHDVATLFFAGAKGGTTAAIAAAGRVQQGRREHR